MSGLGPGGSFGLGARGCGSSCANFSLTAAFRTCSSGTCRLTRSRNSRLERGTFSPETTGGTKVSSASHPDSRARPVGLSPSPSATLSSRPQRVWKDFLSCSSTAFAASNWHSAAARAACSSSLKARLLLCAGAPRSCSFSLGAAAADGGSDRTGEGGAKRKRTWEQKVGQRGGGREDVRRVARPSPSSPAAPFGPRPAGPPAPSAAQDCSSAARSCQTVDSGSGSDPGQVQELGLQGKGCGVLGVVPEPPRPLPLPPTPARTPRCPSSWCGCRVPRVIGHDLRFLSRPFQTPLPETVSTYAGSGKPVPNPPYRCS